MTTKESGPFDSHLLGEPVPPGTRIVRLFIAAIVAILALALIAPWLGPSASASSQANITVYVDFEGYNLGQGFYIKPTAISVPAGTSAGAATQALIDANPGYSIVNRSGYLASLKGPTVNTPPVANPPSYIGAISGYSTEFAIGEFDYTQTAGWCITVNHEMIDHGAWSHTLSEGDVIRWQFTVAGLGADLGISDSPLSPGIYRHEDKTVLIRALFGPGASKEAQEAALDVIINPLATWGEIQAATIALRSPDAQLSSDASVKEVMVSGIPALVGPDNGFSATLASGSNLAAAKVTVTPSHLNATCSLPFSEDGGATWTFTITAEDKVTSASYTLHLACATLPENVLGLIATDGAGNPDPARGSLTTDGVKGSMGYTFVATPASPEYFVTAIEYSANGVNWANYYPRGYEGFASTAINPATPTYFRARFIKVSVYGAPTEPAGSFGFKGSNTNAMGVQLAVTSRQIADDGSWAWYLKRWEATTSLDPGESDWTINAGNSATQTYQPGSSSNAAPSVTSDITIRPLFAKVEMANADISRGQAWFSEGGNYAQVKLEARAEGEYAFAKWSVQGRAADGSYGTASNSTVNPGSAYTPSSANNGEKLTSNFCTVSAVSADSGKGSVSIARNETTLRYALTASPASGHVFSCWERFNGTGWDRVSTSATNYMPNPTEDSAYRAVFSQVSVIVAPDSLSKGEVSVSTSGAHAAISAWPTADGYYFGYWETSSDDGETWSASATKASGTVTATSNVVYRAHFYPVSVDNSGTGGTVSLGSDRTAVSLKATPAEGYGLVRFERKASGGTWIEVSETMSSSTAALALTVREPMEYRGIFARLNTVTLKGNAPAKSQIRIQAVTTWPAWSPANQLLESMLFPTTDTKFHNQDDGTFGYVDVSRDLLIAQAPFEVQLRLSQKDSRNYGTNNYYDDRYEFDGIKVNGVGIGSGKFLADNTVDATGQLDSGLYWYYGYNSTSNCYIFTFTNYPVTTSGKGLPNQGNKTSVISGFSGDITMEPIYVEKNLTAGQKLDLAEKEANLEAAKEAYKLFLEAGAWEIPMLEANTLSEASVWMNNSVNALVADTGVKATVNVSSFTPASQTADGRYYFSATFSKGTLTAAASLVSNSILGKVLKGGADKAALASAIASTSGANPSRYTPESWVTFAAALQNAQEIYTDPAATQAQSDMAASALLSAYGALEMVEPAILLSAPDEISGSEGSSFNLLVWASNWPDGEYKLLDGIIDIPEQFTVEEAVPSERLSGGTLAHNVDGGKFRFVYTNYALSNVGVIGDEYPILLFTLRISLATDIDTSAVPSATFATLEATLKSSPSQPAFGFVTDDTATVKFATPGEDGRVLLARELYRGDGKDLIPDDLKMMAITVFSPKTPVLGLSYKGNLLRFSPEFSERNGVDTWILPVSVSEGDSQISDKDNYSFLGTAGVPILFADTDGNGTVNAQDALNVISAWLREVPIADSYGIAVYNVTADARIDTFDALAIMEHYVKGSEFPLLSK